MKTLNNLKYKITNLLFDKLNRIKSKNLNKKYLLEHFPEFLEYNSFTEDYKEKAFAILNDIKSRPICRCNKEIPFNKKSYNKYCSIECSHKNRAEDTKSAVLKKYNVKNVFMLDSTKQKSKETNLKKYNTEFPMKNENIKKKSLIRDNSSAKEKRIKTNLIKYKVQNTFNLNKIPYNKNKTKFNELKSIETSNKSILEISELINASYSHTSLMLRKLNKSFKMNKSNKEIELSRLIPNAILNSRSIIKPYELDLYSKEFKFAIEYNGLMWHSYGESEYSMFNNTDEDPNYHLRKTELAEQKGISLIHIFENEYKFNKDFFVSLIKEKQNLNLIIDNLTIKDTSLSDIKDFYYKNSIDNLSSIIEDSRKNQFFCYYQKDILSFVIQVTFKDDNAFISMTTKNFIKVKDSLKSQLLNDIFKRFLNYKIYITLDRKYNSILNLKYLDYIDLEYISPKSHLFKSSDNYRKFYDVGKINLLLRNKLI